MEDLSQFLYAYEKLGKRADREVVGQYIQHGKAARDFANYLELFEKYRTDYRIEEVLAGRFEKFAVDKLKLASFDENSVWWDCLWGIWYQILRVL